MFQRKVEPFSFDPNRVNELVAKHIAAKRDGRFMKEIAGTVTTAASSLEDDVLTVDKLRAAVEKLKKYPRPLNPNYEQGFRRCDGINTLWGLPIVTHRYMPIVNCKMKLSNKVKVSDEFRADYNRWLESFFGGPRLFIVVGTRIYTHPENLKALQRAFDYGKDAVDDYYHPEYFGRR